MEKVSQITTGLFLFSINFEKSLSFTQYLKIIKSTSFQGYKYKKHPHISLRSGFRNNFFIRILFNFIKKRFLNFYSSDFCLLIYSKG